MVYRLHVIIINLTGPFFSQAKAIPSFSFPAAEALTHVCVGVRPLQQQLRRARVESNTVRK